jgi:hypothetical protein
MLQPDVASHAVYSRAKIQPVELLEAGLNIDPINGDNMQHWCSAGQIVAG